MPQRKSARRFVPLKRPKPPQVMVNKNER